MLRTMIQAAKSDGNLDDAEHDILIGQLGDDVDIQEAAFVQAEMKAPVDLDALVAQVPIGMGPQVYAMSVIAINLDSQVEAQYLHKLVQGLRLSVDTINDVHAQLGVPSLYAEYSPTCETKDVGAAYCSDVFLISYQEAAEPLPPPKRRR